MQHKLTFHPRAGGRAGPGRSGVWARLGEAMRRSRRTILAIQWSVILFYLLLVVVPAWLPLPPEDARLYSNLRLFAQFLFWGVWWPFVMLGTMLCGRVWCGVFCPEGALTEFAGRHGPGRAIPRWMRWSGWPLTAFVLTTVYGQLVSVYEYPKAALLVLGGSTVVAVAVGFVYGRGKRVWCRYLCPANGVFALLAKISPLHFAVDEQAWQRHEGRPPGVDCAPLINIRHMKSASACHACGRCSGYRGAVWLAARAPGSEILTATNKSVGTDEALMLIYGLLGVATAAFQWSSSPWFVRMKTAAGTWLIERDIYLPLQDNAPWWLLTHYPEANDVFTWLDGACIIAFIAAGAVALGSAVLAAVLASAWLANDSTLSWQRLALALVPIAGIGVFLGLSMLTLTYLKAEGLPLTWVPALRGAVLAFGTGFSAWLGVRLLVPRLTVRAALAYVTYLLPLGLIDWLWRAVFFG
jgi:hypothetical protein